MPQRESMPSQRGVLEASYPQDHLRSYVSQSIARDVKQDTPPRLAVETRNSAEHISQDGDTRSTPAAHTPQAHDQKAHEQANEIQKAALPLVRIMSKGDYISKIALEVYGYANEEILALIKKHNPQIKDINRVEVGAKVLFPAPQAALQ
jgi:hypothetical protein